MSQANTGNYQALALSIYSSRSTRSKCLHNRLCIVSIFASKISGCDRQTSRPATCSTRTDKIVHRPSLPCSTNSTSLAHSCCYFPSTRQTRQYWYWTFYWPVGASDTTMRRGWYGDAPELQPWLALSEPLAEAGPKQIKCSSSLRVGHCELAGLYAPCCAL